MDNQVAINFLDQVRKILLADKSWLESTKQPINEVFDMAISALEEQDVSDTNVGDIEQAKSELDEQSEFAKSTQQTNTDTIYRQSAIDIVVFECGKWTGLAKEISKQIKQLPSAQPENIRCYECKHGTHSGCGDVYICNVSPELVMEHTGDFYCGYAERRTDNANTDT